MCFTSFEPAVAQRPIVFTAQMTDLVQQGAQHDRVYLGFAAHRAQQVPSVDHDGAFGNVMAVRSAPRRGPGNGGDGPTRPAILEPQGRFGRAANPPERLSTKQP